MGRYRPPPAKKSPYITAAGMEKLKQEEVAIWKRRREVVKALSAAAAEGDRSENAEYIYRKKELRELDRRIRYLQKRIPELKVITEKPASSDKIFFGCYVSLENIDGEIIQYRIVGPDEYDLSKNWISMDSPFAKKMLKRSIFDEFDFIHAGNATHWTIVEIKY